MVQALYEWLHVSGAKLATIGMKVRGCCCTPANRCCLRIPTSCCAQGPLPNRTIAFDMDISIKEHGQEFQSAAFVVVHKPGSTMRIAW